MQLASLSYKSLFSYSEFGMENSCVENIVFHRSYKNLKPFRKKCCTNLCSSLPCHLLGFTLCCWDPTVPVKVPALALISETESPVWD